MKANISGGIYYLVSFISIKPRRVVVSLVYITHVAVSAKKFLRAIFKVKLYIGNTLTFCKKKTTHCLRSHQVLSAYRFQFELGLVHHLKFLFFSISVGLYTSNCERTSVLVREKVKQTIECSWVHDSTPSLFLVSDSDQYFLNTRDFYNI